jgi:hypothetical protein
MFSAAGMYDRAIVHFTDSQFYRPNRLHTLYGLARTYSNLGNVKSACDNFNALLKLCSLHTPGMNPDNGTFSSGLFNFLDSLKREEGGGG